MNPNEFRVTYFRLTLGLALMFARWIEPARPRPNIATFTGAAGSPLKFGSLGIVGLKCKISLGIAPTRNCTNFLKIGYVVAGGGFYYYYILKGNKSDKERKIVRKS